MTVEIMGTFKSVQELVDFVVKNWNEYQSEFYAIRRPDSCFSFIEDNFQEIAKELDVHGIKIQFDTDGDIMFDGK